MPECPYKLGMENGGIADNQLSSTTPWVKGNDDCIKEHSRLNSDNDSTTCNAFAPLEANDQGIYYYL